MVDPFIDKLGTDYFDFIIFLYLNFFYKEAFTIQLKHEVINLNV